MEFADFYFRCPEILSDLDDILGRKACIYFGFRYVNERTGYESDKRHIACNIVPVHSNINNVIIGLLVSTELKSNFFPVRCWLECQEYNGTKSILKLGKPNALERYDGEEEEEDMLLMKSDQNDRTLCDPYHNFYNLNYL